MGEGKLFTEKTKGRKITNEEKARMYLEQETSRIITNQKREEAAKKTINRIGNGKYIDAGIVARLFDIYDLSLDLDKIGVKGNVNSFMHGYYEAANTQLGLICNGIIPGRVKSTLESRGIKDNCDLNPEHILFNVGGRDALDQNIKIESMPTEVKNNKFYLQGYKEAIERLQNKGKGSR